jgi:DNA-directed RNA polymerase specialized sigma24 family protein
LDPALLEPLVLRYFAGLDSTEIGSALGLNASTVRSRLREARLALAGRLMQRGVEP